jgi:hypothetical protein
LTSLGRASFEAAGDIDEYEEETCLEATIVEKEILFDDIVSGQD